MSELKIIQNKLNNYTHSPVTVAMEIGLATEGNQCTCTNA